ncbi:hypothetical protein [Luedemannella helvata]|uniref:Uncharacterized protein n=1 Tax=Luedemannella helvata TaxID=349315 RepID=A0ABN2JRB8_9ACTN
MNVWWELTCELGHHWTIVLPEEVELPGGADLCPLDGSPAITAKPEPPADRVCVTLRPAARVVDTVTGQIGRGSEYCLEISSHDGRESRHSAKAFTWEEAVRKAAMFQKASWALAVQRWTRMGLDKA